MKHYQELIDDIGKTIEQEYEMSGLAGDSLYMGFASDVAKRYCDKRFAIEGINVNQKNKEQRRRVTEEALKEAFITTHFHRNNESIIDLFNTYHRFDLPYYLLQNLDQSFNLTSTCLHSDGGVLDYLIIYKIDSYQVIISREHHTGIRNNFESLKHFCEWLNHHIDNIIQSAKNK